MCHLSPCKLRVETGASLFQLQNCHLVVNDNRYKFWRRQDGRIHEHAELRELNYLQRRNMRGDTPGDGGTGRAEPSIP